VTAIHPPSFILPPRCVQRMQGVHSDLCRVVVRAAEISPLPFVVLEGLRTIERQRQLVNAGASRTLNSRHLTGHAVDLAPLADTDGDGDREISWRWPHYDVLAPFIFRAATECGVPIEWGGNWPRWRDGPHWQLPRDRYP
jgi:peptidoglycan LD-endopeptidase CwlK